MAAADLLTDRRVAEAGVTLSVAALYRRCTSTWLSATASSVFSAAPESTSSGRSRIGALDDDEYRQLIKGGLDRLAQQLTSK